MTTRHFEDIVDGAAGAAPERERYRGVMLGLAAGNCLGLPYEGQSHHGIKRHHPGGVRDIDPAERERLARAVADEAKTCQGPAKSSASTFSKIKIP
jgi:hypothetical protein